MNKTRKEKLRNKKLIFLLVSLLVIYLFIINFTSVVSSQTNATEVKYCCEKTKYGAWCQNAPENECDVSGGLRKTPTSCEATSYCKLGCCYDSSEGICMENTPQKVCSMSNGTWADDKQCDIAQCQLGCCVIGTQAAYVSLTRCKKLSSFYGLQVDFRGNIGSELECINLASLSDEGACVYGVDFIKTCKFTSRQECNTMKAGIKIENESVAGVGGEVTGEITFYKNYLCSNEELGTNCGLTKETTCIEGKDGVYFKDSCGNPANIYDASKINDKAYWGKKVSKAESCGTGKSNINSPSCGNCDYFSGSICKDYKTAKTSKPSYGNNICQDLNCKDTTDGPKKHGESWCSTDKFKDSVGSRYFRHLCMNGEEIIEPCADFRQEECIQDTIESKGVSFSQASCRVNRWQDCLGQDNKKDCENTDKRDCVWNYEKEEVETEEAEAGTNTTGKPKVIACVPLHPPGLKFWEEGEAQGICSLANTQCIVTYEKKGLIFSGSEKCTDNCECLTDSWKQQQLKKCEALGDCGAKVNYVGVKGFDTGYNVSVKKVEETEEGGGGLLGLSLVLSKLGITGKAVQVEVKDIEKEKA